MTLTFDCILVFSAIRFNSGVSATLVAFALGICLEYQKELSISKMFNDYQKLSVYHQDDIKTENVLRLKTKLT